VRPLLLLSGLALVGCHADVGPTGLTVGASCRDQFDCAAGSFCLQDRGFPDGTCTQNCGSDGDCPGDSRCVEVHGGVCLLPCDDADPCTRTGYACQQLMSHGGAGDTVGVCSGS